MSRHVFIFERANVQDGYKIRVYLRLRNVYLKSRIVHIRTIDHLSWFLTNMVFLPSMGGELKLNVLCLAVIEQRFQMVHAPFGMPYCDSKALMGQFP